ncbi:hypothetical protein L596_012110 [Steinernema carpocapsae]|uniref:Uncharacterized protein n=1 Tax=Steinernema carpocapsae TaxID=34508 RepID=A0A4U5NW21_STECR|nr:hypothetical protein L596_012110 [Steinernema carpocapsae]
MRLYWSLCVLVLVSDCVITSVISRECPPGEVWIECGGCENTCECPSRVCDETECRTGCFCDPDKPFLVRNNSTCVNYWECDKLSYGCCPACQASERCVLTPKTCGRPPCQSPTAKCERTF